MPDSTTRNNQAVGRRSSTVTVKRQHEELLERLRRTKYLRDLLTMRSSELAAMYARACAREGHDRTSSIARISLKCQVTETEATSWVALGEAMLAVVPESG